MVISCFHALRQARVLVMRLEPETEGSFQMSQRRYLLGDSKHLSVEEKIVGLNPRQKSKRGKGGLETVGGTGSLEPIEKRQCMKTAYAPLGARGSSSVLQHVRL
ncbi:hypothetical protein PoB_006997600 [Plakobranchus ocellatus]|uniref:Uncharacterized protein n=1 Tax=Plakobranchus ocellatus TaxID=259542 RepID=A0AAV4DHY7_9GAST|nr:hypothetical protein PoB_006997600 [Plakobranchus ocellatus]